MANILFRRYVNDESNFSSGSMNTPPLDLEKNILQDRNMIISSAGEITYNLSLGQLLWTSNINIFWTADSGKTIQNIISAGNITLADGEFAFVDLNIVDGQVIPMLQDTLVTGELSQISSYMRIVLGYRDGDNFFPSRIRVAYII